MDVFACIGDVLPPLKDDTLAHLPMIALDRETMETVLEALGTLDTPVAKAYEEAVRWAM